MSRQILSVELSGWRISWQATGLYSLTALIAFVTAFPNQDVSIAALLLPGLVLTAAVALLIHTLDAIGNLVLPAKIYRHAVWVVSLSAIVGLMRGFGFFSIVQWAGLPEPTPLAVRLLTSTLTTVLWLVSSCALVQATMDYSRQFTSLFNQSAMALALRRGSGVETTVNVDSLDNLVALKRNLSGILQQASDNGVASDTLVAAGAAVREQIETLIRPLSHRLWFNEQRNRPEVRMRGLIADALSQSTFLAPRILLIWGTLAFASIVNTYAIDRVIFGVALSVALLAFSIYGIRALGDSVAFQWQTSTNIAFMLFISVVPVSIADLLMPVFGYERMLFPISAATIVSPIAILVLLTADSCVVLVEQDRALVRGLFETQMRGTNAANRDAFASYLHNSLQSELTGIAYRLEASAAQPNAPESRATLEKLGALINRSISEDFANFDESPLTRLARLIEAWEGIAAITVDLDPACENDARSLNLIVQVIEEATTNSVHYGGATRLNAEVRKTAGGSTIHISSDARESSPPAKGLGSDWLRQHAISVSPLVFSGEGATFTVEV